MTWARLLYGLMATASPSFRQAQVISWLGTEVPYNIVGSSACPCINPWGATGDHGEGCRPATVGGRDGGATPVCLPADYGAGQCKRWDDDTDPRCVDASGSALPTAPDWCAQFWCFVDASQCDRPNHPSTVQWEEDNVLNRTNELTYSYETCGNVDSYDFKERDYSRLRGRDIRVAFPGDSRFSYALKTLDDGSKDGSYVQFMQNIAEEVGFTLTVQDITEMSVHRFPSSFTACTHDVALNEVDLCIGNFIVSAERLSLAPFSPTIYTDEVRLVVLPADDTGLDYWAMLATPFAPFTSTAWWIIAALALFSSAALLVIEVEDIDPDDDRFLNLVTNKFGIRNDSHPFLWALDRTFSSVAKCCYHGVLSFTSGSLVQKSDSLPGRIVYAGFAAFGLIILTAYTASSAATLVANNKPTIQSIDDVIAMGPSAAVCVGWADMGRLSRKFPSVTFKRSFYSAFEGLANGECVAATTTADEWDLEIKADPSRCKWKVVGGTLDSTDYAMPINDELQLSLSSVIHRHLKLGKYDELAKQYREQVIGTTDCAGGSAAIEAQEFAGRRPGQLNHEELFAPFATTFICTTLGLVLHLTCGRANAHEPSASLSDRQLKQQLQELSPSRLRARLTEVDEEELAAAMAAVPDTTLLVELAFKMECSAGLKAAMALQGMSIPELLIHADNQGISQSQVDQCLDDKDRPRQMLTELILGNQADVNNPVREAD